MTVQTPEGMRFEPKLPVEAVKTYRISVPLSTHWRRVSCEEAGCHRHAEGWVMIVNENDPGLGQAQGHYLRKMSGRRFATEQLPDGRTKFWFPPGQQCFEEHRVRNSAPERFLVVGGDWRGNPRNELRVHSRPQDWVEDFALHQDELADRLKKG
jgi:hypothetical protein